MTNSKIAKAIKTTVPTVNVFENPVVENHGEISLFPVDATKVEPKITIAQKLAKELELRNAFVKTFNNFCYKIAVSAASEKFDFEVRSEISVELACEIFRQNGFEIQNVTKNIITASLNKFWHNVQIEISLINEKAKTYFMKAIAGGINKVKIETKSKLSENEMNTVIRFFKSEGLNASFYNGFWSLSF